MNSSGAYDAITLFAVLLARLGIPLFIPRFPLPAMLATVAVDSFDQSIIATFAEVHSTGYQTHDKALDVYYLTVAYASTIRNWGDGPAFVAARALWYYRLAGVVLFEYSGARWLLLVFPNTFEYFFIAIELIKVSRNPFVLTSRRVITMAAFLWIFVKLPQEWWLHIAQLDVTDIAKERVFGAPTASGWWEAIANRPIALVPLLTLGVALLIGARAASRALPPKGWGPTWSADVQAKHIGWPGPARTTVPSVSFGWAFVEKAVLVTFVTVVFVRILPGTETGLVTVAVGATSIMAASTLTGRWLAERGITWRSPIVQFAAVLATNVALALAAGLLVPAGATSLPIDTLLFLIMLLSLIVVLFDRCSAIGHVRRSLAPGPIESGRRVPKGP